MIPAYASLSILREHLLELLDGGGAHLNFEAAVAELSPELWGKKPPGQPHTLWRLIEHLRICQWDILEFCRHSDHVSPEWPAGYWPTGDEPPDDLAWDRSLALFRRDSKTFREMIADSDIELLQPIPWGDGQTIAREAMLLADHNAYHLGQFVIVRRLLGAWPENDKSIAQAP